MASSEAPVTLAHLVGPIHGVPDHRERFRGAKVMLEARGKRVTTPIDAAGEESSLEAIEGGVAPGTPMWQRALRKCLMFLLRADEVWVLSGWETSKGTNLEIFICMAVGIPVYYFETSERLVVNRLDLYINIQEIEIIWSNRLLDILRELVANEIVPCTFDQNGQCQEHGWYGKSGECGVREARQLMGMS